MVTSLILLSYFPLWWWSSTPQNMKVCFCCVACFLKPIGFKQIIICTIVKESDSILITNSSKIQLSFNCCFCIKFVHQVNISRVIIMIHKHVGCNISYHRWDTFVGLDKTTVSIKIWSMRIISPLFVEGLILYCLGIFLVLLHQGRRWGFPWE